MLKDKISKKINIQISLYLYVVIIWSVIDLIFSTKLNLVSLFMQIYLLLALIYLYIKTNQNQN